MRNPYDILQERDKVFRTAFFDSYESAPISYDKVAQVVQSNGSSNDYKWLADIQGVSEWLDERQETTFDSYEYSIKNKKWESTVGVTLEDLEDDNSGQIIARLQQRGTVANQHKDILVYKLLADGFNLPSVTGQNFFAANHDLGGITFSNLGTSPLSGTAIDATITSMMQNKNGRGDFIVVTPNVLVVGPKQRAAARDLVSRRQIVVGGASVDNPHFEAFEVVVTPYIEDNSWMLLDTTGGAKPIILQIRKDVTLQLHGATQDSSELFFRDKVYYGTRARYNVGFGVPLFAYGHQVA